MKLSIVIVNYNVRYFIDQCIRSILLAEKPWNFEIIVVDNCSTDQSVELIREKYPAVKIIANRENKGFSVACNQGLAAAAGEHILFLNPDTILRENSLVLPVEHLDQNPGIGAVGVKMVDGSGQYLPESKRGLPTPFVAFCKASGLSGLFPKSSVFNRYYLGHLPHDENAFIDVLSGAFMMVRREVLEKTGGGFDEDFFMYGEDIDLSYRITTAGYQILYLADTTIIHFKGESTKKVSFNYVKTFYKAMEIFANKHFSQRSWFFKWFLKTGIYIRALLSVMGTFLTGRGRMLIDFAAIYLGFIALQYLLGQIIHGNPHYYPETMLFINLPFYALLWLIALYLSGYYSRYKTLLNTFLAVLAGGLILIAVYGLTDTFFRSSRAVLLVSGIWVLVYTILTRLGYNYLTTGSWSFSTDQSQTVILIGEKKQILKALDILQFNEYKAKKVIPLSPVETDDEFFMGTIDDIDEVAHAYRPSEVIFCEAEMRYDLMMEIMNILGYKIKYRILTPEGDGLISSFSSSQSGELFSKQIVHRLSLPHIRASKRLLDMLICLALLPFLPLIAILVKKPGQFLSDWFSVIRSRKTWVGYHPDGQPSRFTPELPPACIWEEPPGKRNLNLLAKYNYNYSMDYRVVNDLEIFFNRFKNNYR